MRTLLLGLFLGMIAGLLYGWILQPVEYIDTTPNSLRQDYKTDYVLAVAEAYAGDGDLDRALVRLAALGPQPPASYVAQAIDFGVEYDFGKQDLETLNRLAIDLRSIPPAPEIGAP